MPEISQAEHFEQTQENRKDIAVLQEIVKNLAEAVRRQGETIDKQWGMTMTKEEFASQFGPIRLVVFGLVGLILTSVFTAILAGIITPMLK